MMLNFARSCLASMEILTKSDDFSNWHLPFYFLAVTSLESSAKLTLFKRMEKEGKAFEKIEAELRRHSHNIFKLYSPEIIGFNFLSRSNILKVDVIEVGELIFRYHFFVNDQKDPIYVYDAESMKYGLMSKKENASFVAYQTSPILKLCKDVFRAMTSDI